MPPPPTAEADTTAPVAAFDEAVTRYADVVYARCRRSLQPADADDAVQAVFWILHRRWDQARSRPALVAWLLRTADLVVRNARRDERRRQRREQQAATATVTVSDTAPAPDDDPTAVRAHLDRALAALPAREREALALHYLAGHSLAEVAVLSDAGVSTVKERIQRGAEKLRLELLRQGVACSVVALLQVLSDEAQVRLAPALDAALRHPPQILSPRLRRWTRHGAAMATLLSSLTTTVALVAIGLNSGLHAAHADAPAPTAVQATPPAGDPFQDACARIDPAHARGYLLLQLPDGRASADRLAHLPELAFLPDHGAALAQALRAVREGTLLMDSNSMTPTDLVRSQFELQRDMARLPPVERQPRLVAYTQRMISQGMEQAKAQVAEAKAHPGRPTTVVGATLRLPLVEGSLQLFASAPPETRVALQHLLGLLPGVHALGDRFVLSSSERTVTTTISPTAVEVATTSTDGSPSWPTATALASLPPSAGDIDCRCLLDPGDGALVAGASLDLRLTSTGLHLVSDSPQPPDAPDAPTPPVLDRTCFRRVPGDAMAAAATALTPASTAASLFFSSMTATSEQMFSTIMSSAGQLPAGDVAHVKAMMHACFDLLRTVDGTVLFYLQPGAMIPSATLEIDCPKAASDRLLALIGQPLSEDGILHLGQGMQSLTMGWRAGQLIVTTNPQGMPEHLKGASFADTPEIRAAEAALPVTDAQTLVLMRPASVVTSLGWCVGLAAPGMAAALPGYQRSLAAQEPYAYLLASPTKNSMHLEASGMLSFIAAAAIAAQMRPPQGHG